MASELARNGGEEQVHLAAIQQKANGMEGAELRPVEALMIVEWMTECEDPARLADLVRLFKVLNGVEVLLTAITIPVEPAGKKP